MSKQKKISVAVIYGGVSGEHEVSLQSAASVIAALDRDKYDVLPVRVGKDGRWSVEPRMLPAGAGHRRLQAGGRTLTSTRGTGRLVAANGRAAERMDFVFPLVHGTGGEDGCLQGLLELAGIPYAGSGVLGSAVGMDKVVQKKLYEREGLPVAPYVHFRATDWNELNHERLMRDAEALLGYPVFVKPANLGSSVGISKAHHRKELRRAIEDALRYDSKVLIEKAVPAAREIECAVIGNDLPETSVLGEIIPSNEFYDYAAKYLDGRSRTVIPADLPSEVATRIRQMAGQAFLTVNAAGMARVDFLLDGRTNDVYLNEINTIPGFTPISMFAKLWNASGLTYGRLLDRIIALGQQRAAEKDRLVRSYDAKK